MSGAVNLARRPFANIRHIRRLAVALWVVAAGLLGSAGVLYWRSLFGIESKKEERAAIDREIAQERERLETAEQRLAAIDLADQNTEANYLNLRIAERTFPWSKLFDELADVLPRQVRLLSLTPASEGRPGRGRRAGMPAARLEGKPGRDHVYLEMTGIAETDEALLELLDNLFASEAFDAPSLPTERRNGGVLEFVVSVYYLPRRGGDAGAPAVTPAAAPAAVAGAGPGAAAAEVVAAAAEGES